MFCRIIFSSSTKLNVNVVKDSSKNLTCCYHGRSLSSDTSSSEERSSCYQPVADFYSGRSVFLTGGTGFLGKVFIERLLFNCPEIDKVYVLVREKKGVSAKERVQDLMTNPLFSKLRQVRPNSMSKIIGIQGDMTSQKLGIKPDDLNTLLEKVSVVFHSGADVRFLKPLRHLLHTNVEGTRELLKLSHRMVNIEAFVHVSTAFSHAEKLLVDEIVYPPPDILSDAYKLSENDHKPKATMKLYKGKVNRYTYSKAITETMVVQEHGNVPTIIVRPSMVGSIAGEPFPGWVDNRNGATGFMIDLGAGVNSIVRGQKETVVDLIPVDYTVNLAIVAATKCGSLGNEVKVYNSCTSSENPLVGDYAWRKTIQEIRKRNNVSDKGTSKIYYFKSRWTLSIASFLFQTTPAFVADCWLWCRGKNPRHLKELNRAITVMKLINFFTSQSVLWKTKNTHDLYASLSRSDQQLFPFNPADISWEKYIEDYIAGIHKYLKK